jgi:hypothetical protein
MKRASAVSGNRFSPAICSLFSVKKPICSSSELYEKDYNTVSEN